VEIYSADWVLPVAGPPLEDGAVAVEDGCIVAVGAAAEVGEGIRFPQAAILPGLVNAHSHLEYAVYGGFGDGLPFAPWIVLHTERKTRLETADMEAIARLGAAECLRSGITTVGDASFRGAAVPACAGLGLRAIVYLEVFGRGTEQIVTRFEANAGRIAGDLSENVRLGVSPHAPYTCSLELYQACWELGLPVATHLAEGPNEDDWVVRGSGEFAPFADVLARPLGTSGIRALSERGLLDSRVVAAHCVTVDDDEIELLAAHAVSVAHCPRSNALLGCGIAPLRKLLDRGITVGLGTDSPASAPSFDMFEELRAAVFTARASERRTDALTCAEALELATLGSARALGLSAEIGSLERGKRADLTVVDLAGSSLLPWEDPTVAVVLGGSPDRVAATIVEGKVRYERGAFGWQELRQRGTSARSRLLGLSPLPQARAEAVTRP
jgi:cytosine/adenosine deaminase-related metal-dependent hydrolase